MGAVDVEVLPPDDGLHGSDVDDERDELGALGDFEKVKYDYEEGVINGYRDVSESGEGVGE